jgi:hypothetical protein
MILNPYIHDQLAATRRHDLLDARARCRVASPARRHPSARRVFEWAFRWRVPRRPPVLAPRVSGTSTWGATW